MSLLTKKEIETALKKLPGWKYDGTSIHKEYTFNKYLDGIEFVRKLAFAAEKHNHHPDLRLGWCKVAVIFTSHDQGGVTEKCLIMAREGEEKVDSK